MEALIRANLPHWALNQSILEATLLDHPWADEDLPSLVAVDPEDGGVVGFIGVQARRMRFDGEKIRGVCCSHLAVSPTHRKGAAGALLLGRVLNGPQELTWSDAATDAVARVWRTFGGHVDHARAADFMLVLHPVRWTRAVLGALIRRERIGRELLPVGAFPVQAAGERLSGRLASPRVPGVEGEDAGAETIAEHLPTIWAHLRARVDWDPSSLRHAFDQVEKLNGPLTCRLVRRRGKPIGWYAYLLRPGGISRLLHLGAVDRMADAVFTDLVDHADALGSAVLAGRAEPHLEWPLHRRLAVLGFAWKPVIRAADPELAATMSTSASLLTRLGGELSPLH